MAIQFSILDLFKLAFPGDGFDPEFKTFIGGEIDDPAFRKDTAKLGSPYYANDLFGREYFLPVTITYTDGNNGIGLMPGSDQGQAKTWNLPYPLISIMARKTIVETPMTDRRGTVKELINIRDYEISIKGLIIDQGNEFPEDDVTVLRTLFEQNVSIQMQCPLTDIFLLRPDRKGSDTVVITELRFPEVKGIKNVRPYEIMMLTDGIFNLIDIAG